ncbi:MAG: hypothetical protein KatS3mg030_316 [Saprospiraceae bacterium]|nr:MAG: hypothetical protein KatS3mg030_316 [Saprospiraceae bacterium]
MSFPFDPKLQYTYHYSHYCAEKTTYAISLTYNIGVSFCSALNSSFTKTSWH